MNDQRLLAVFAHPDDETFATGGTLAACAARGVHVTLVCATRGEAGELSDEALAAPDELGAVRENELRCAAEALGISDLIFLDYRDSGMAGTAENERPEAFVNQPAKEVVARLVAIIRSVRPQVVLTFDPQGGYGHPDHIAAHDHTVAAFRSAVDPQFAPGTGDPWQADRLFYGVFPRSRVRAFRKMLEEAGAGSDIAEQMDEREAGWPDERVNVVVDVSDHIAAKRRALACHRTQFGAEHPFHSLPKKKFHEIMGQEYFSLAWPAPAPPNLNTLFD